MKKSGHCHRDRAHFTYPFFWGEAADESLRRKASCARTVYEKEQYKQANREMRSNEKQVYCSCRKIIRGIQTLKVWHLFFRASSCSCCSIVRLFDCSIVRSFACSIVRPFDLSIVRLSDRSIVRSFVQFFSAYSGGERSRNTSNVCPFQSTSRLARIVDN